MHNRFERHYLRLAKHNTSYLCTARDTNATSACFVSICFKFKITNENQTQTDNVQKK